MGTATAARPAAYDRPNRPASRTASRRPAGHRRQNHHRVAIGHSGVESPGETDVLVVDVDIHAPAHLAPLDDALLEPSVPRLQVVDERGNRVAGALDGALAAG